MEGGKEEGKERGKEGKRGSTTARKGKRMRTSIEGRETRREEKVEGCLPSFISALLLLPLLLLLPYALPFLSHPCR